MFYLMSLLFSCAFLGAQRQRWLVYHILIMVFKAFTIEMFVLCFYFYVYLLMYKNVKIYFLCIEL